MSDSTTQSLTDTNEEARSEGGPGPEFIPPIPHILSLDWQESACKMSISFHAKPSSLCRGSQRTDLRFRPTLTSERLSDFPDSIVRLLGLKTSERSKQRGEDLGCADIRG